jgi:hypothetical protein
MPNKLSRKHEISKARKLKKLVNRPSTFIIPCSIFTRLFFVAGSIFIRRYYGGFVFQITRTLFSKGDISLWKTKLISYPIQ